MDAIRPPAGYELDRAVGTAYCLDLMSLLAVPLGFALYDRQGGDGTLMADPVDWNAAVHRYAERIDMFCHAGQIAPVREQSSAILAYLESSVHEVAAPLSPAGIFHPKIWVIRYGQPNGDSYFRLLCLSRNLTFDRSWDTVLCLNEKTRADDGGDLRLADFVQRLPELTRLTNRQIAPDRLDAIKQMANDLRSVVFSPPEGFDPEKRPTFWPIGLGRDAWPLESRGDRLLVISPFLTVGALSRLSGRGTQNVIISRPESFDQVGKRALAGFAETLIISPLALSMDGGDLDETSAAVPGATDEGIAERAGVELRGLHAKLYLAEQGNRARLWTGSANATDAAFSSNVEFLVELEGSRATCGIDAILGEEKTGVGLRKMLIRYSPGNDDPLSPTAEDDLERAVDALRSAVARLRFTAAVRTLESDSYGLMLEIGASPDASPDWWDETIGTATLRCRPQSLGEANFRAPISAGAAVQADFETVAFDKLTSFFVIEIGLARGALRKASTFIVNADLVGAPEDRLQRVLVKLFDNPRDFLRFLLLLLDHLPTDHPTGLVDVATGERASPGEAWKSIDHQAPFEPLVRALATELGRRRLDEIQRLVMKLEPTGASTDLLPANWQEIWKPIWLTREELCQR